jgi:hypothetical protein
MNKKIMAGVLALVMIVAFLVFIGGNGSQYNNSDTFSGNDTQIMETVDPEFTNQINSELMNEGDSIEIGEMI